MIEPVDRVGLEKMVGVPEIDQVFESSQRDENDDNQRPTVLHLQEMILAPRMRGSAGCFNSNFRAFAARFVH